MITGQDHSYLNHRGSGWMVSKVFSICKVPGLQVKVINSMNSGIFHILLPKGVEDVLLHRKIGSSTAQGM